MWPCYLIVLPVQSQTPVSRSPRVLRHVAPLWTSRTSSLSWPSLVVVGVVRGEVLLLGRLPVRVTRCVWWLDGSGSPVFNVSVLEVGRVPGADATVLREARFLGRPRTGAPQVEVLRPAVPLALKVVRIWPIGFAHPSAAVALLYSVRLLRVSSPVRLIQIGVW